MGESDRELLYKEKILLAPADQEAADAKSIHLMKKFIKDFVLKANIDLYKTEAEISWAYIARREYRYNVTYHSFFLAGAVCSFSQVLASVYLRRVTFLPWLVHPVIMLSAQPSLFSRNVRKLFGMVNVGTEYELGAERNRVLEECNRIAQRADV